MCENVSCRELLWGMSLSFYDLYHYGVIVLAPQMGTNNRKGRLHFESKTKLSLVQRSKHFPPLFRPTRFWSRIVFIGTIWYHPMPEDPYNPMPSFPWVPFHGQSELVLYAVPFLLPNSCKLLLD